MIPSKEGEKSHLPPCEMIESSVIRCTITCLRSRGERAVLDDRTSAIRDCRLTHCPGSLLLNSFKTCDEGSECITQELASRGSM